MVGSAFGRSSGVLGGLLGGGRKPMKPTPFQGAVPAMGGSSPMQPGMPAEPGTDYSKEIEKYKNDAAKGMQQYKDAEAKVKALIAPKVTQPISGPKDFVLPLIAMLLGKALFRSTDKDLAGIGGGYLAGRGQWAAGETQNAQNKYEHDRAGLQSEGKSGLMDAEYASGQAKDLLGEQRYNDSLQRQAKADAEAEADKKNAPLWQQINKFTTDLDRYTVEQLPNVFAQMNKLYAMVGRPELQIQQADIESQIRQAKEQRDAVAQEKFRNAVLFSPNMDSQKKEALLNWAASMPPELTAKIGAWSPKELDTIAATQLKGAQKLGVEATTAGKLTANKIAEINLKYAEELKKLDIEGKKQGNVNARLQADKMRVFIAQAGPKLQDQLTRTAVYVKNINDLISKRTKGAAGFSQEDTTKTNLLVADINRMRKEGIAIQAELDAADEGSDEEKSAQEALDAINGNIEHANNQLEAIFEKNRAKSPAFEGSRGEGGVRAGSSGKTPSVRTNLTEAQLARGYYNAAKTDAGRKAVVEAWKRKNPGVPFPK